MKSSIKLCFKNGTGHPFYAKLNTVSVSLSVFSEVVNVRFFNENFEKKIKLRHWLSIPTSCQVISLKQHWQYAVVVNIEEIWTRLFAKNRQKNNIKRGQTDMYRDKSIKT